MSNNVAMSQKTWEACKRAAPKIAMLAWRDGWQIITDEGTPDGMIVIRNGSRIIEVREITV